MSADPRYFGGCRELSPQPPINIFLSLPYGLPPGQEVISSQERSWRQHEKGYVRVCKDSEDGVYFSSCRLPCGSWPDAEAEGGFRPSPIVRRRLGAVGPPWMSMSPTGSATRISRFWRRCIRSS